MSGLPRDLRAVLTEALGTEPLAAALLGGGMISRAARVETASGPVFVKWKPEAPPGFFAAEADGLGRLSAAGALRVPKVLAFGEGPAFLALEYLEARPPTDPERSAARFGAALAALHRENSAPAFGLDRDNYLGLLPQPNTPAARWSDFYRACRLAPQIALARHRRLLSPARERLLGRVLDRLEPLLADLPARPALLHGDLWSGNVLSLGDEAAVIDPAAYYGEREMEVAYMELFGGFPPGLLTAYRDAFPLEAGYARRRPLHQLYHLLVHLNHFGERYGPHVDGACRLALGP